MSPGHRAEILSTHTPELFTAAVQRAADLLRAGQLVALPTETVYGLAANALDPAAVARIFEVKGRPAHNPIIVHVAGWELAKRCVRVWPEAADKLASAFWPGPLTLVLPRASVVPDIVTAGGDTVGIRWPSHPFIQAVIRACDFPLAAPSANPSNRVSPTTAMHVRDSLGGKLALIVDGGPSQVGIESTVVDLVAQPAHVLRPGMIHTETLAAVLGESGLDESPVPGQPSAAAKSSTLRSPGQLERHYRPKARVVVWNWRDDQDLKQRLSEAGLAPETCWVLAHSRIPADAGLGGVSVIPHDAEAYARAFYAGLHSCDAAGAACIIVEALPDGAAWQGITDRLRRAAS